MALNVTVDLEPFERINVCGYRGLAVTRLADHAAEFTGEGAAGAVRRAAQGLTPHLLRELKFGADYSAINTDLQAVNSR